jgi:hypothetical protein
MRLRFSFRAAALSAVAAAAMLAPALQAQGRGGQAPQQPTTAKAAAPIDLTGYWVSLIVDEWRFRVKPEKGDILYMPLNADARRVANAWDPDKDLANGDQCKAYGAVGVMQRPGRIHITWQDDSTLKLDFDAGTQTRVLHFGPPPADKGQPSLQGYSAAQWVVNGRVLLDTGGTGFVPGLGGRGARQNGGPQGGTLHVTTTNMLPGYLRKNGVPYSEKAVLNEYINLLTGQQNDLYLVVTAMVDDPTYLTQPFIRSYTFKKQPDGSGWDPTPCLPR